MIEWVRGVTYQDLPEAEQEALCPRVLPYPWQRHGRMAAWDSDRLRVLLSAGIEDDGKRWLHLSCSRRDRRTPTWEDLTKVRDVFAGPEALAIHVVAPRSEHYDAGLGMDVMHLWVCLDGRPIPDFRRARGGTL